MKNKKIYEKSLMIIFKISNYLPRSYRMFTIELSSWNSSNIVVDESESDTV